MNFMKSFCLLFAFGMFFVGDVYGAVILQYHRFGESRYPSTNTTVEQFRSHLDYLRDNDFEVLPLEEIVDSVQSGIDLGDRVVGLSIDDAFLSAYEHALPILREYGFPVTLFVVAGSHGGSPGYMSWSQLLESLGGGLVSIGSQTFSHPHMPELSSSEVESELFRSESLIEERLGVFPNLLAYPYGEASLEVMEILRSRGYRSGFGQHSGALGIASDNFYLPRFSVNEQYGDIESLRDKLESLPLGVEDFSPREPVIGSTAVRVSFRVTESVDNLDSLSCYVTGLGRVDSLSIDSEQFVVLEFAEAFPIGRTRLSCTLRHASGRYHWFGRQFVRYE